MNSKKDKKRTDQKFSDNNNEDYLDQNKKKRNKDAKYKHPSHWLEEDDEEEGMPNKKPKKLNKP